MTPLAVLAAPLLRALTGGRYAARTRARAVPGPGWTSDWEALLAQLGLPKHALHDVATSGSLHPHFHYRPFTKPKKDGGQRQIVEPDSKLKRI
jgi:hypothetical protein